MVCLLKIIVLGNIGLALHSAAKLLYFLRKIQAFFECFVPNKDLLIQMDFDRLLGNGNDKDIIDLLIFINRYYEGVDFEDFLEDQRVVE